MRKTIRALAAGLLLPLFFLCLSCGSVPLREQAEQPVPEELSREEPASAALEETPGPQGIGEEPLPAGEEALPETEVFPPETPSEVVPGKALVLEAPDYGNLPEPEIDFAEARLPDFAPPEEDALDPLPEPVPLALFPAAEPVFPPEFPPLASEPAPEPEPVPEPEAPVVPAVPSPAVSTPADPVPAAPIPAAPSPAAPIPAAPVPAVPTPATEPGPPPEPPRTLRPVEPLPPPAAARENPPVPVNPIPDIPPRNPWAVLQSPTESEEELQFSRVVRATVGQLVEIPFRGTGWVFLGELGGRRGIAYGSRRLDPEGQSFIFRAEEAGTYALKFYKQDFIRDYILNDYVQVIIGEAPDSRGTAYFNPPVDRGRVIAEPRWPLSLGGVSASGTAVLPGGVPQTEPVRTADPAPAETPPPVVRPSAVISPVAEVPPAAASPPAAVPPSEPRRDGSLPPGTSPEGYISRAREEYNSGRVASALSTLDQFREAHPAGSDEAWWLYGQFLEANGPQRDIRSALDYYRRLIREYPQSSRYDEARRRIAYLERYYFNIP